MVGGTEIGGGEVLLLGSGPGRGIAGVFGGLVLVSPALRVVG